ncbi:hypothetical protein GCM10011409_35300 [Lentibacillus populi]|uniref:Fungal lipase-like domain-containing protein n=1 Tax=Lentibacillus populi TaxID=1827502 RepID=A0A9W5U0T5_9BACI|nr:YqiA/YcfP family alpha/beta fold hydrolase [Lentibacillus populi]GGB54622.1 hypothetical protein GCM10011409_35300 [Lentibacillus populi]
MGSLTDKEASKIAKQTYQSGLENVHVDIDGQRIIWKTKETIRNKETGLKGYVLENEDTGEVVISFEGTQVHHGFGQAVDDLKEDVFGIVLGGEDYTEKDNSTSTYTGLPGQEARIANGYAEINEDGKVKDINKNQFTAAEPLVKKYVKKYGKDNITFVGHSLGGGLAEYFAVQYSADAITFASADIYDLLTKEQKERVQNGYYKDKIISYTYPNDLVGTFHNQVMGSLYYMSDPSVDSMKWFSTHGITENYANSKMFDENGYFLSQLLYDSTLYAQLKKSPLELKNNGVHGFSVVIKSEILRSYAQKIEENTDLIEQTENSLRNFYDYYVQTLQDIKSKYSRLVGYGKYDMLSISDVEEIFSQFGKLDSGVPIMFNMDQYDEILTSLKRMKNDTGEIAYNMNKMGNEFEKTDYVLAQWLGLK